MPVCIWLPMETLIDTTVVWYKNWIEELNRIGIEIPAFEFWMKMNERIGWRRWLHILTTVVDEWTLLRRESSDLSAAGQSPDLFLLFFSSFLFGLLFCLEFSTNFGWFGRTGQDKKARNASLKVRMWIDL